MTIFERFVFPIPQFFGRFVWDSSKIWICGLYVSHDSSDRNLSSSVETYPLNQSQISIFTEEVLKLIREKGQVTAWDLYNVATEIYKPGRTDFPALIPQNGAMAELLLSRLPAEVEIQDAVLVG